ncbi:polymer-forming cytoskeletal protein [Metabacillus arenae]|uniref:Polymer-forming cytoskeletal protein n=1 Tax=Metabacillus arenae TaxID=2771434 RepID=A0A926NA04_9BACI|nr:polymer-forming cytoskeletal protein [Metabacillus arenae]MBD1379529.1 polymer-forming cytoskeletal protein [Metabacillus arenae]
MGNLHLEELEELKINGSGIATGGMYKNVKLNGSGKINGDIECQDMKISGSGKVKGNIKAENIKTSGSSLLEGDVEAEYIESNGSSEITGDVKCGAVSINGSSAFRQDITCEKIEVNGTSKIGGELSGGKIRVNGSMKVAEGCEGEEVIVKGSIQVGGLLNADFIDLKLGFHSNVKEIGGEKINIKKYSSLNLFKRLWDVIVQRNYHLEADVIEGDVIHLEATKAKLVRGKDIIISEKCEIDTVEYTDSIDIHPNSVVREKVHV